MASALISPSFDASTILMAYPSKTSQYVTWNLNANIYFSIWSCCNDLCFFRMIKDLFENSGFKETHDSSVCFQIPNNARTIRTCCDCLGVTFIDVHIIHSASMFLQTSFHVLGLSSNSPDPHFSFHASWYDSIAGWGGCKRCDSMIMSIINSIIQFSWLRKEGSDLSIIPSTDDTLSVTHEFNWFTFKSRHFNSKKFLSGFRVPHSNIIDWTCSKNFWIIANIKKNLSTLGNRYHWFFHNGKCF